ASSLLADGGVAPACAIADVLASASEQVISCPTNRSMDKTLRCERHFTGFPCACRQNAWLMSRSLLNIAKRSLLRLMLSCVGLASRHAAGGVSGLMRLQCGTQCWKLLVSLQSSEAFSRFLHGRRGPAHRHRGRAPSLHVPADSPHRAHHVLDDIGASERASQLVRQSKRRDGADLIYAFQDRARDPGPVSFETLGKIAEQLFSLVGIVQLPGLSQHTSNRSVQRFGQSLHNVAGLVDLTALDCRGSSEGSADCFGQGLGTVDDEEPRHRRVEPALDEIVDERLN